MFDVRVWCLTFGVFGVWCLLLADGRKLSVVGCSLLVVRCGLSVVFVPLFVVR